MKTYRKIMGAVLALLFLPSIVLAQPFGVTRFVSASPTCDTSAYATGELIGTGTTGKLTFSGALRGSSGTGYIVGVKVSDKAAQAVDFDLVIFSRNPSATTFTDQAAFDISDTDLTKVVAVINLGSSSRFAFADNSVHYVGGLFLPVEAIDADGNVATTLYAALVSRGTPTFATGSDVTVTLEISQD